MPTLTLFDLDDTLAITDSKIKLRDADGQVVHRLTTNDYRDWKGQGKTEGFVADYEDFANVQKATELLVNAKPGPGLAILQDAKETEGDLGILTLRSSEEAVVKGLPKFLSRQGVNTRIDPKLIFALGDRKYSFPPVKIDSELKLIVILKLLEEGPYDSILLIDDDPMHKRVIDEYCASHDIKNIHVYLVAS